MTLTSPAPASSARRTPPPRRDPGEPSARRGPAPAHGADHHPSVIRARAALDQIAQHRLPADPRSFAIWYAYAEGTNAELNRVLDEATAQNRPMSVSELDDVYDRFFLEAEAANSEPMGEKLAGEVDQILAMLSIALGSAGDFQANLAGATRQLAGADGRESLRGMVETLVSTTRDVELKNDHLQARLRTSKEEIDGLRADLDVIRAESITDALTGLANRKHFDRSLEKVIAAFSCNREPFSLLLCDVDHFKGFNDTFGHVIGDQVLRLVGGVLKQTVRRQDVPARYGGEEFAVILPRTNLTQAGATGENIRIAIACKELVRRKTGESLGRVTVSIGAAEFEPGESAQSLIERADACLYAAKRSGRNCVVLSSE